MSTHPQQALLIAEQEKQYGIIRFDLDGGGGKKEGLTRFCRDVQMNEVTMAMHICTRSCVTHRQVGQHRVPSCQMRLTLACCDRRANGA